MSEKHFFYEPGTIGGIPGTFSGVVVEVDEAHTRVIDIQPLPRHLAFEPAVEEEVTKEEQAETPPEQPTSPPANESPAQGEQPEAQV